MMCTCTAGFSSTENSLNAAVAPGLMLVVSEFGYINPGIFVELVAVGVMMTGGTGDDSCGGLFDDPPLA